MTNGAHEILELEGIRPKKLFQPAPKDFAHTNKVSYAEKYQPDILPKIAAENKKAKVTQHKKKQKENTNYFNSLLAYKKAFEALNETKFIFDGQELKAMDFFKQHCIYNAISKIKKDMNFDEKHALVVRWGEYYLLGVVGEFDAILELKNPSPEEETLDTE